MIKKLFLQILRSLIFLISLISTKAAVSISYYLFVHPKRRHESDWMVDFLASANETFVQIASEKVTSFHWQGNGPTVLFLHGWKSNSARWKYLIEPLQKQNYNLVSIDAPGHGRTPWKEFNTLFYAQAIEKTIERYNPDFIVAHSVGGYAALFDHKFYSQRKNIKYILMAPTFDIRLPFQTMFEILGLRPKVQEAFIKTIEQKSGLSIDEMRSDNLVSKDSPQGILIHDVNDTILPHKDSKKIVAVGKALKFVSIESTGHRMQSKECRDVILSYLTNP